MLVIGRCNSSETLQVWPVITVIRVCGPLVGVCQDESHAGTDARISHVTQYSDHD